MNYELVKELENAGFLIGNDCSHCGNGEGWPQNLEPTLEELIEACGDRFRKLMLWSEGDWRAHGGVQTDEYCAGFTPTEAVARLWLALNKK